MKKSTYVIMSIIAVAFIFIIVHTSHSSSQHGYSALAMDLSATKAFCLNEGQEDVDIIDIKTRAVTNTILRDKDISALAVDDQRRIVAAVGERKLHLVSMDTLDTLKTIQITSDPLSIAIDSSAGQAVIVHKQGAVSVINLITYSTITTIDVLKKPVSVAVDPGLRIAVVAHEIDKDVDGNNGQDSGARGHGDNSNDNITLIDLNTLSIVKTLQAGKAPVHIAINASTHQAAVANEKSDTITIIDLTTRAVAGTFSVHNHPKTLAYNDCLNTLAVIGGEDKSWLQVMDGSNGAIQASYDLSNKQKDIVLSSSLNKAYLAGRNGLTIQDLPNPMPELTSLSPNKAVRGGPSFSLTAIGKGLFGITEFYLNADKIETTSASCNSIKVEVPYTYLEAAGQIEIKTNNPSPEGGASNILTLTVENPVPVITTLQPSQATAGASNLTLIVNGVGFFSDTSLYVNNVQRQFTFVNPTQLHTTLIASDLENGGYLDINAANPQPGGGLSITARFAVQNPVPSLTSIDPSTIKANSADTALVLTGDNFVKSSTVYVNRQPYSTRFVNKTRIETTISASVLKTFGSYPVKVTSPGPGGGETQSLTLTVSQPGNTAVKPLAAGSFGKQYEEIIPLDATISAYTAKRFAIVTGLVKDRSQNPISDVKVSLLGLPEYGSAKTDATGRFSIPVDGGGALTAVFEKAGLITSHRQVIAPWNDIINTDTVTMLSEDMKATAITFDGNPSTVMVHTSSMVTDTSGSRSLTMVFTGDNRATITDANGNQSVMTTITTRATEFDTPASMPAKLPPTSAYTYCSELSVDGAKSVKFDKPVTAYVDNFLGFHVGEIVPVGYYDRGKGVWMASDNGVVVRLLDTNGDGVVDALDTVGDGLPHETNVVGLTDPGRFKPNATFWRVKMDHFSPWDCNWPYGPPLDAVKPIPDGEPSADQQQQQDGNICNGSYCENKGRIVHEDLPIAGMDMTLHYASNRVPGYKTMVTIPASGASVPASLIKIIVRMEVAGRMFETTLPPSPNQKTEFVWDGLDHLGKPVAGSSIANISIGFGYWPVYYSASSDFYRAWDTTSASLTGIQGREEFITWKYSTVTLNSNRHNSLGTGFGTGWTLSVHHYMNPWDTDTLIKGDGTVVNENANVISSVAGTPCFFLCSTYPTGDNMPAKEIGMNPAAFALDSGGKIYIGDSLTNKIKKVDEKGIITTVAGDGSWFESGDGGLATNAGISVPTSIAVDAAGNIYFASDYSCKIRKIDTNGIITTIAGTGCDWWWSGQMSTPDGNPAALANLGFVENVAVDNSGNIYISEYEYNTSYVVRKIDSSGILSTVAGDRSNGSISYTDNKGDGGPATSTRLIEINGLALDNAGNIYIGHYYTGRIKKVDTRGIITTVAGDGNWDYDIEGIPATEVSLPLINGVTVDKIGNLYISAYGQISKVNTRGILTIIAGRYTKWQGYSADGTSAYNANVSLAPGVAVDGGGNVYINDNGMIRKIAPPTVFAAQKEPDDIAFDEDGYGHIVSSTGLHKETIDLQTGKTLRKFGYNSDSQLISTTDRFDNVTVIQRDSNGKPTSITSPDGIVTSLVIDSANNLAKASYPDGSSYSFGYTSEGLLTDELDRRGSLFVHEYDTDGRITNVFDPEGGTWNYSRTTDKTGNVFSKVLTGENNLIAYQDKTDSTGALTSVRTDPTGETTTITLSSDGLTEATASSCGMQESRQYDLDSAYMFKHLTAATIATPAGLKLTYAASRTYQDNNGDKVPDLITVSTSKNSRTWTTTNNALTGVVTATSPDGRTTISQYEPSTLLTQQIAVPGLYTSTFSYDTRGRLVSTTSGSRTTTVAYDTNGHYDYIITPDNKKIDYTYDVMGKLRSLKRPDESLIQYDYDLNGSMTVLTNPMSVTNTFDYTANKQRKTWTTPQSGSYQYSYDKERKLKTITFPSGKVISNTYTHGLLTSTNTSEGGISYTYGCGSNLSSVTRGGEGIAFTYDGTLVTTETRTGTLNQSISYTYNNDFKLSSMTYAGTTQNFGYDNDRLLVSTGTYAITRNAQNGLPEIVSDGTMSIKRTFSGYGELDESAYAIKGTLIYDWTVTRDTAGRIMQKIEFMQDTAMIWDYGYDELGRLSTVKQNNVTVERYSYDADGNRLTETNDLRYTNKTFTYSAEDHVLKAGTDTYQFDKDGFLTNKITSAGMTTFTYSLRGELLSATLSNGTAISYDHDPLGRRIAKRVNGTIIEKYLWQGMTRLLAVYDGSNNLVMRFQYADGRMPVSMTKSGVTYYLACDQIGSLRAVMDSSGALVKELLYDSFGSIIYESNIAYTVPFGFAGGLHDRDTGLVRFGFRDYDPNTARWMAKDPIDFSGGDLNLFGYVGNNPINRIDPLGLRSLTDSEKNYLTPYISQRDLNNADVHVGEMPWYAPEWAAGITRGNDIYIRDPNQTFNTPGDMGLLGHELVHVGQYGDGMTWLSYLWASQNGYDNNPYEVDAYEMGAKIEFELKQKYGDHLQCSTK